MIDNLKSPLVLFARWHKQAGDEAVALATATKTAVPSVRMVLLKGFDERGFVFYGGDTGRKSAQLRENPRAALCFYWRGDEDRQVRVEGEVSAVEAATADAYFATRPRDSRLSAWASKQSQTMGDDEEFAAALKRAEQRFAAEPIPRPQFWNGWRLAPSAIEFWRGGEARRHHRLLYEKRGGGWVARRLYP